MSFNVEIEVKRDFEALCSFDKVFGILSNVPVSVSHFPNVEKLIDMGEGIFKWEMQRLGTDKYNIQTVYACKYTNNKEEGWVKWDPVPNTGNAVLRGEWKIKESGDKTKISFFTNLELTIPLSSMIKIIVTPIVKQGFNAIIDTYINNLQKTFNG
ncbi:MAG: hypothetical protein HQK79_20850 [Desulfobacterales bacterium]|nr:hypothetical protein [Desulfobacterales bacterium]MBF0397448.1 hypothetical protein [Desulfobacterales bacterium]